MTIPSGWYDDGSGNRRWWDGQQWTAHVTRGLQPMQADAPTIQPTVAQPANPLVSTAPPGSASPPISPVGVIGLVAAGLGLACVFIPLISFVGWGLLAAGFLLSVVSLFLRGRKWPGIAGIVIAVLGVILALVVSFVALAFASAMQEEDPTPGDAGSPVVDGSELVPFDDLEVGDCLPYVEYNEDDLISELPVVPCDQPHSEEVYFIFTVDGDSFPGEESLEQTAWGRCVEEFEGYVGTSYEESAIDFYTYQPTRTSWTATDDRTIHCILFSYEDVTEPLKDAQY